VKGVIAIVDDDEWIREAVANLMSAHGYEAKPYASADEFLQSAERGRTICLIVDVNMPGMSGPQLHQRLIDSGETIPTILITAHPDESGRDGALRANVQCYLTKPFSEDELLVCVSAAVDNPA
jgi:FixJ family two-component response regulator